MRREFGLGEVVVTVFYGHRKKDTAEGWVNSCRWNLFNERMKAVKVKDGQNSIGELGQRHSQRDAKVGG